MEIVKNRYGLDRVIEKIDTDKIKVMGETQFERVSKDRNGNIIMFDFEGGPILSVGSFIQFKKLKWKIKGIDILNRMHSGLSECVLTVNPMI